MKSNLLISCVRDPQFADTPWSGKGGEVSVSSNFKRKRRTKAQKEEHSEISTDFI